MSKVSKIILSACLILILAIPVFAFAQSPIQQGINTSGIRTMFGFGPLQNAQTLDMLIAEVVRLVLRFVGLIAILFIIIGGYRYITSQGNEEVAETGKNTLINAIIGLVIIALAYVIVTVVVNTILIR